MPYRPAGRVVALLTLALAPACVRDEWTYDARVDVGAEEVAIDAPMDLPATDAGPSCPAGQHPLLGACVEDEAPRPVAPLSLGDVTQRRPTLRWALTPRYDGAVVELCRDRGCTMPIDTLTVSGSSARPERDLPPRSVVFWRLRGRVGATTDTVYGPTWLFHVPATSARTGVDTSANPHFDVNADGYDDLVVGALNADPGGQDNAGSVSVFHGSARGISATPTRVIEGIVAGDVFGVAVGCAGDLNGDGYADLAVGASLANRGGRVETGTVSVYHGSPSGIVATRARVLEGTVERDYYGSSVASAGDVNGDGYGDLVVGANGVDPGGRFNAGTANVFHGSPSGIAARAATILEGALTLDAFGYSSAGAGDVNGDGYSDLVVGSVESSPGGRYQAGRASVFHGGPSGIASTASWVVEGSAAGETFGVSVASAGDVNGDGYSDIVVGARRASPGGRALAGSASVFHGSPSGITPGPAARRLDGIAAGDQFGSAVARAGDVNGDGYGDIVVGAPLADPGGRDAAGSASVFHGSAVGVAAGAADRRLEGVEEGDDHGRSVGSAGDVDGDGYGDVVVGAPLADPGGRTGAGSVWVFQGSASGVPATANTTLEGAEAGDNQGYSVASRGGQSRRAPSVTRQAEAPRLRASAPPRASRPRSRSAARTRAPS